VTASGIVVPAQEAQLAFPLSGILAMADLAVGDEVEAGAVLARLGDREAQEAEIANAERELADAEGALQLLQDSVAGEQADTLKRIAEANAAVKEAQYALDNFTIPHNQRELTAIEGVNIMKEARDAAWEVYKPYKDKQSCDDECDTLLERWEAAQGDYNAAVRRLEYEVALSKAQSDLELAMRDFNELADGPKASELARAEARIKAAQANLAAAQATLADLDLKAPFAGTVAKINVHNGEWVIPGQPVLLLTDLAHLRVETTDLSERDVPRIETGQTVTVYIEALGQEVTGRVSEISPLADTLGGDVVYKTTIDLDKLPPGLRAGMSVEANFETDQ
jgi:multidrug resistance efflux pump